MTTYPTDVSCEEGAGQDEQSGAAHDKGYLGSLLYDVASDEDGAHSGDEQIGEASPPPPKRPRKDDSCFMS